MEFNGCLCLKDIPFFSELDNKNFRLICHVSSKHIVERGEYLFHQGDCGDTIYLVKEGSFKLVRITDDGKETIVKIVGLGETIGETNLFRDTTHPVAAVALERSKVCSITRQSLEKIIRDNPDLSWQMIMNLGKYIYSTWEHITDLNTQTTKEKVLSLLMRLSKEHGKTCEDGMLIKVNLTQQDIASLVGASRVMVAQVLKELVTGKYIDKNNKYYIIKNRCF